MQKNKKFLLPIITAISILFSGYIPVMADVDLSTIPAYTGEPYVEINDNVPDFPEDDFTTDSFESYSDLDNLGRCGVAYANIGQDLMPTEKRGSIGQVKPSGWHTQKYDNVDGKFAYNRCHLIGYQLTAENANEKNLITGTRYLNVEGMLPFENMVADYKKQMLFLAIDQDCEAVSAEIRSSGRAVIPHLFNWKSASVRPGNGSGLHISGRVKLGSHLNVYFFTIFLHSYPLLNKSA